MPGCICNVMPLVHVPIQSGRIRQLMLFLLQNRLNCALWAALLMAMSPLSDASIACRAMEKTVRVRSTCLVQYDSNRLSYVFSGFHAKREPLV